MSRPVVFAAALLALATASCSSTPDGPPRAQNDICAIYAERPDWPDAVNASARKWNVPPELIMAIIWKESSFRAEARTPRTYFLGLVPTGRVSSAYGYAQAIDGTWDWYREDTGRSGADRDDFDDAADFVGWYLDKSRSMNGVGNYDAYNHYLNYHEGHTGFRRGSYRNKAWLMETASRVADQTARYRTQLPRCAGGIS